MAWISAVLTLLAIGNVAAVYLFFCQRGLERSLLPQREVNLFPEIGGRRGVGAAIPAETRAIGGRRVTQYVAADAGAASIAAKTSAAKTSSPAVGKMPSPVVVKSAKKPATKAKSAGATAPKTAKAAAAPAAKPKTKSAADATSGSSKPKKVELAKDDLKRIKGVGKVFEGKLNGAGVYSLKDIAAMSQADLQKLDDEMNLGGRTANEKWIEQAKTFLA
ncbi:MAG: hypothetical protein AAGI92_05570 [Pseudomonadota bacterium]